jgi:hypothetical protein
MQLRRAPGAALRPTARWAYPPMYKLIALYPQPTDPEHFRRYYEERH